MPAAPSPLAWPVLVGTGTMLLPAAAALAARRSFVRTPEGQLAAYWLLMTAWGAAGIAAVLARRNDLVFAATASALVAQNALLAVPLLAWAGPRAARRRWLASAALALGGTVLLAALGGPGRRFQLVGYPIASLVSAALVIAALVGCARRAAQVTGGLGASADGPDEALAPGWLWIGVGHLTYFLVGVLRMPLVETLVPRHFASAMDVQHGIMFVHALCFVAVAAGIARGVAGTTRALPPAAGAVEAAEAAGAA